MCLLFLIYHRTVIIIIVINPSPLLYTHPPPSVAGMLRLMAANLTLGNTPVKSNFETSRHISQ